ncbi:MobF family relaxase, partial [Kitasatospora sp. NPDC057595]|uniref:MobF family relaxase n=2 Tax=unclassified Kitasatospora TaxID=2633591 RepID=UPI0036CCAE08
MAYVTAIGPSEAQVEYRLTGLHGCATSDASLVPAGPTVEAIRAHAQALGVEPAELFGSDRQRQIWGRVAAQADARGESYRIKPSTIHGLMKSAGAGDPAEVYGEELQAAAAAEADPRIAYRMDLNERPLMWIGSGLREFGIEAGSELTAEQFDMARAMMKGVHPLTGETLVEPKMAVDARGKLAARPLVEAIQQVAAERGVEPAELFDSERKRAAYGRMERGVHRLGDAHRVRLGDVAKLADALSLDTIELYGQAAMDKALQHEDARVQVGNQGFDLTITMPKSFSVALAFADGEFAAELEGVFTSSLVESVGAAEEWTAYGMRGHHGDGEAAQRVSNSGLMGWVNFHRAARPVGDAPFGDPHLHGHVTLANLGHGEDGQWSTIAAGGRDLYRHARAIDSLMQARVRAVTHERWGFEWHRNADTDVWQITGIPDETVALFSKRSAEVRKLFEALGIPFEETTSAQQKTAAAAVAGRKDEQAVAAADSTLRSYWQAEARAADQDPAAIIGAVLAPPTPPTGEPEAVQLPRDPSDIDAVARWVFRTDEGLTSHRKDFTRAEALAAVADAVSHGVQSLAQVEELTDRVMAHRGLTIRLDEKLPGHLSNTARYTTADIVVAERTILGEARGRFNSGTAVVDEPTFAMAVSTYQTIQRADNPEFALSAEQLAVLRRILVDGHGVDAVVGVAGAGKTTIMEVARMAWEAQGRVVLGASTAAVAAANLRAEAGIQSSTVALLLQRIRQSGGTLGLVGVDVLVLDEAAMVDDRQLAELLTHAATTGTKIVGIGDPLQLQSPGVGGAFAAVHQVVGGHTLSTNYRQRDAVERAALQMWRDGERREALRAYADRGRITVTDTRQEAMAAMLVSWQELRNPAEGVHDQIASTLMLAATNATVDELNVAARAIRRELGELTGQDVEYKLAGGGTLALTTGDIVMIRRNDYRSWRGGEAADVLNGFRGVVVELDDQRRALVEWREKTNDGGHRLVREWLESEYIAGGGLSHGLAMTVHKAQGLTVADALVYGPGLAANGAYTAMSRDKASTRLFLPRADMEDEQTRVTLGEPETDAAAMDRAVAVFAAQLDANNGQEPLIITELGETLEPLTAPPAVGEPAAAATAGPVPAAMPTQPQPEFAEAVREALAEHAVDADDVLDHPAYAVLDEALAAAAEAGVDPAGTLDRAVASRPLTDVENLPAVLAWRVEREVEAAEQEAARLAAEEAAELAEPDAAVAIEAAADVEAEAGVERPERRPLRVEPAVDTEQEVAEQEAARLAAEEAAELAEPDAAVAIEAAADVE